MIGAEAPLEPADPQLPRRSRRSAGATATAAAKSASSPRSRRRSAATARARGCRPRASSTPACSPPRATTSSRCCAAAPTTTQSLTAIGEVWSRRDDRYSEIRTAAHRRPAENRNVVHRRVSVKIRPPPLPPATALTPHAAAPLTVHGRRAQRTRRNGADADRRRAPADALRRQARDRHADDAGRRARGAGDRLSAQPAAGRRHRGNHRSAGRLGSRTPSPSPPATASPISTAAWKSAPSPPAAARARCSAR